MKCRVDCGACCIAITISSPIPGLPQGKEAGVWCLHLAEDKKCGIFHSSERPKVCADLRPSEEMCGNNFKEAFEYLSFLEHETKPINIKCEEGVKV